MPLWPKTGAAVKPYHDMNDREDPAQRTHSLTLPHLHDSVKIAESVKQADEWQEIPKVTSEDLPDDWCAAGSTKGLKKAKGKKGRKSASKKGPIVERSEPEFETISGEPGIQEQTGGQGAAVEAAGIPTASPVTQTAGRQPSSLDSVLRAWTAASSATAPASPPPSERSALNLWAGGLDSLLTGSTTGIARAAGSSSWANPKQVW